MFQVIHMKNQALFSLKDKSKNLKRRLLHFCLALKGLIKTNTPSRYDDRSSDVMYMKSSSYNHSVYSLFEKTAGYVINRCLQTHVPFRG